MRRCHNQFFSSSLFQGPFNDTKVTISGLNPVTTYRFQVFADNGVSEQVAAAEHQYIDIAVTTEASVPSSVSNVRVINVRSTELTLRWDAPDDPYTGEIEMYEVRYFIKGAENNASSMLISRPESAFSSLRQQTVYGFQVRAKTTHGWGEFSPPVFKTTGAVLAAYEHTEENLQVRIIAGAVVAGVILVAIIAVVTVLYLRRYFLLDLTFCDQKINPLLLSNRGNDECNKKQPSDCDTLEYRNGEGIKYANSRSLSIFVLVAFNC